MVKSQLPANVMRERWAASKTAWARYRHARAQGAQQVITSIHQLRDTTRKTGAISPGPTTPNCRYSIYRLVSNQQLVVAYAHPGVFSEQVHQHDYSLVRNI